MKENGILMKPPLIEATMAGLKTQTRRVIKPHPVITEMGGEIHYSFHGFEYLTLEELMSVMLEKEKYKPGDILYIKEGFSRYEITGDSHQEPTKHKLVYRLSDSKDEFDVYKKPTKWKSPMFMPKFAARTWLKVKSVRVERVQDISEEDALSEGIKESFVQYDDKGNCTMSARNWFSILWDSINAKPKPVYRKIDGKKQIISYVSYPWESPGTIEKTHRGKPLQVHPNPWVYVYDYELVER